MTGTVALLHGFTGSPSGLSAIADLLRERALRVETPALLGHGARDDTGVADFEGEVERLSRVLAALGEPVHLAGYSLGGRLAIGLLCRHPELCSGATLISAQPGLIAPEARAERRSADEGWCAVLETRGIEAFVDAWEKVPLFATQANLSPDVLGAQRAERLAHSPSGLVRSLRTCGLGQMPPYWSALELVQVPTTILVGELDGKFVVLGEQMRAVLANATLRVVPGAGHNVLLEQAGAVVEDICRAVTEGS